MRRFLARWPRLSPGRSRKIASSDTRRPPTCGTLSRARERSWCNPLRRRSRRWLPAAAAIVVDRLRLDLALVASRQPGHARGQRHDRARTCHQRHERPRLRRSAVYRVAHQSRADAVPQRARRLEGSWNSQRNRPGRKRDRDRRDCPSDLPSHRQQDCRRAGDCRCRQPASPRVERRGLSIWIHDQPRFDRRQRVETTLSPRLVVPPSSCEGSSANRPRPRPATT